MSAIFGVGRRSLLEAYVDGGALPTVDRGVINVPAGTLDDDPGLRPQRHIFVDLKASWFDIADTLPRFSEK